MIYISLDTCVWLELLKVDFNDRNILDEMCFWIEAKQLIHIVPENVVREWDRNKIKKIPEILKALKSYHHNFSYQFRNNEALSSIAISDIVEEKLTIRVQRVDNILKTYSELANESPEIIALASKRALNCLAPNHQNDSFRDTVNLLTLAEHVRMMKYQNVYFSTINYDDFSANKQNKHELHSDLIPIFNESNLQFVYFDENPRGNRLINEHLRPHLPSFDEYLRQKEYSEIQREVKSKQQQDTTTIDNPDTDFLENVRHLDIILGKPVATKFEQEVVDQLINRHESYRQYFFRKVGNDGMV